MMLSLAKYCDEYVRRLKAVTRISFSRDGSNYPIAHVYTIRNKLAARGRVRKQRSRSKPGGESDERPTDANTLFDSRAFAICFALPILFSGSDEINTPGKQANEVQQRTRCFPRSGLPTRLSEGTRERERESMEENREWVQDCMPKKKSSAKLRES